MAQHPLAEAEGLFRRRQWAALIRLLEPLEAVYRENSRFLFLLGTAFLHSEDIGAAYSCFRRGHQLDFRNIPIMLGLAAVYVRRAETAKAVQLYIDILERSPGHKAATRGLDFLRVHTQALDGDDYRGLKQLTRWIYPRPPRSARPFWLLALGLASLAAGSIFGPGLFGLLRPVLKERPEIAAISLSAEERGNPINTSGSFRLVLTEQEAIASFDRAKQLFNAHRDEAAMVEINRLLVSNASGAIKTKAEILRRYARPPSFLHLPDRFSLATVQASPYLYEGVAVAWKGLPANIRRQETSQSFEFLVGYQDARRLEGIIEVRVPFPIQILDGQAMELLAVVRVDDSRSPGFYLECVAIRNLP